MPKSRTARVDVQGDPSAANPLAAVSMNAVLSGDRFREAAETAEAGFSYVAEKFCLILVCPRADWHSHRRLHGHAIDLSSPLNTRTQCSCASYSEWSAKSSGRALSERLRALLSPPKIDSCPITSCGSLRLTALSAPECSGEYLSQSRS